MVLVFSMVPKDAVVYGMLKVTFKKLWKFRPHTNTTYNMNNIHDASKISGYLDK